MPRDYLGMILDEFVAVSGYHRKYAIRLLAVRQKAKAAPDRRARRRYGTAVREALIAVWEASDRVCSKRLKPLVAVLLPALERHGRLAIDAEVRRLLLEISPASMDRLLSEVRLVASGGRRRRAGFSSAVRCAVPVRTFGDWNDPPPGFVEADFVAHAGTSAAGSFVQTMVLTDYRALRLAAARIPLPQRRHQFVPRRHADPPRHPPPRKCSVVGSIHATRFSR